MKIRLFSFVAFDQEKDWITSAAFVISTYHSDIGSLGFDDPLGYVVYKYLNLSNE